MVVDVNNGIMEMKTRRHLTLYKSQKNKKLNIDAKARGARIQNLESSNQIRRILAFFYFFLIISLSI